jgi:hypothetical protein
VLPAPLSAGASASVTLTVLVTVFEFNVPSLTCQLKVRFKSAPELVGFALDESNVTESSTCW